MEKTSAWAGKRVVLRGKTADVIHQVPDGALDFAYVDGDHTLRGITIDLVKVFPKIRVGGWIGGDDFSPSIWQHSEAYEPTLVCPFAILIPQARLRVLPSGHAPWLGQPAQTAAAVADFVRGDRAEVACAS
jgi:pimeloyl-ACP methyl ester carboxylesterase